MQNNRVTLSIIINAKNDHVATEYVSPLDRQTYVEGREKSNFSLRIHNGNNFRVLAIPSVDGLSILDGKPAGQNSSGYVLEANQTLDIPGWKLDNDSVAKFFFSGLTEKGEDNSYVALTNNDVSNKGVIGLMVFNEYKPVTYWNSNGGYKGILRGATLGGSYGSNYPTWNSAINNVTCSATSSVDDMMVGSSMGTGFGEQSDFKTIKTEFKKHDLLCMMVIYYDDARGLKRKGIDVSIPKKTGPQAFPADTVGCPIPPNWGK